MRGWTLAPWAVLVAACNGDPEAMSPSTGATGTTGDLVGTDTTGGGPTASTSTGAGSSDGTSTTGEATRGGSSSGGEGSSSGGDPGVPRDCRTLLEARPGTPDGVYELHPGGEENAAPFSAYCDMTTDGGGWTLVGRSAAGSWDGLQFGWGQANGTIGDEATPYSLGAKNLAFEFDEMLFGLHAGSNAWGDYAYRLPVPEHFLIVYEKAPYETVPEPVIGDCAPDGGPTALRWVGWTDFPEQFVIGVDPDETVDGLEPGMIDSNVDDCEQGGFLHGQPGMLMVR